MKPDVNVIKGLEDRIFNIVENYLKKETFEGNYQLIVNAETMDVSIGLKDVDRMCFALPTLVFQNEQGCYEPDCDAIYDVVAQLVI